MTDRSVAFLSELEAAADYPSGLLSRRFLSAFAVDDGRLDAIPEADLARIRAHVLAAQVSLGRKVAAGAMLSPAEVQAFRAMFRDAGGRIVADPDLAPETRATIRRLCPWCDEDGVAPDEDADLAGRPALPGTAGEITPDDG